MKTERITVLGTPEFKAFLAAEAGREGVSVSELVRRRCEGAPSQDEALLRELSAELRASVADARCSLENGLRAVQEALADAEANRRRRAA